ncbi:hypothetical protein EYC80_008133 [Monilinia laxa]|uniref:Uncharacterized protein n=1 Tax=Monilinia laxa TaxID=61186 RepID=A0A5N6JTJ8_MONLA|nr:hypothetical protein EYC80_008133 [Monilinia laxa]
MPDSEPDQERRRRRPAVGSVHTLSVDDERSDAVENFHVAIVHWINRVSELKLYIYAKPDTEFLVQPKLIFAIGTTTLSNYSFLLEKQKVVLETSLKLWYLVYPPISTPGSPFHRDSTAKDEFLLPKLTICGSGLLRTVALQAGYIMAKELKIQLQEETSLGLVSLRPDLLDAIKDAKTWNLRCIKTGEVNMKGYLSICLTIAHTDALRKGQVGEELDASLTSLISICMEPARSPATERFMEHGIFNADGDFWEQTRTVTKLIFSRAQISNTEYLKKRFLDTFTEFIFGQSVNTFEPGESSFDAERFPATSDRALKGVGLRVVLGSYAFLQDLDRSWRLACHVVHDFIDQQIDHATQNHDAGTNSDLDLDSKPQKFILLSELFKKTQGRDTPSSRYNGDLIFDSLKQLKYVRFMVDESLRLLTPSGRSNRIVFVDTILPTGGPSQTEPIFIRKGTEICFVFKSLHIDKDIWGPDGDEFNVERWEPI